MLEYRNIIMTHFGRSGSTVLAMMLNAHPDILWLNEFFTLLSQRTGAPVSASASEMKNMVIRQGEKLNINLQKKYVGHEVKFINFIKNSKSDMLEYLRLFRDPERNIHIVLTRKNTLKRICSSHKAAQTKVYHARNEADVPSQFSLNMNMLIDFDTGQTGKNMLELIQNVQNREQDVIESLARADLNYLEIVYEDHIEQDPREGLRLVLSHLNLPLINPRIELVKTGGRLKDELLNFESVRSQLSNTKYEWMLD